MTAWMIRNDGKMIGVTVHPYGNPDIDEIEETLAASEWLYVNTNHTSLRNLIVCLFASWAYNIVGSVDNIEIKKYIDNLPYRIVTSGFLDVIIPQIDNVPIYESEGLNTLVNAELNQEFLRARYGGMYDTKPGNRNVYFRTSSVCFDWFPLIRDLVSERQNDIETVTVIRDPESTGAEGRYLNCNGIIVNHLGTVDFLKLEDCKTSIPDNVALSHGGAINESFIPCNRLRLVDKVKRLCFIESKQLYK